MKSNLKKKQLGFVKANLERARANPAKCGLVMKERGLYSSSTNNADLEFFVRRLIKHIDKEKALSRQPVLKGFFSDEEIKNKNIGKDWTPEEDDKLLDMLLSGTPPEHIAIKLKRTSKSVLRHIEEFKYDERNAASNYKPKQRISRQGKRMQLWDHEIIKAHQERDVPSVVTANILQRKTNEFSIDTEGKAVNNGLRAVAPGIDLVFAHRYLYWRSKKPVISDQAYDDLKKEEMEFGANAECLLQPASDKPIHYPPHIRQLASYMLLRHWIKLGQPVKMERSLPQHIVSEYKAKKP